MPNLEPADNRMHLSGDERVEQAERIRTELRAFMTADPVNAPACNECVVATLLVALLREVNDIAAGEQMVELMGVGDIIGKASDLMDDAATVMIAKGMKLGVRSPSGMFKLLGSILARTDG